MDGDNYFPFSYGFSLFRSFFMITFSEGAFVDMFNFQDLYNSAIIMIKALNTVYFAWHFYTDFSYYGVFILSFLSGLFVTLFYCNTLIKATLFRSCIWAVIVGMIFLSFMVPFWEFWMSLMNVIVIIIAHGRLRICSTSVFSPKLGTSLTSR